ncbi:ribonuclease P protein component [Xylanimonas ulmi]|uniref:Ribonuclease P protein component n=1 Tax=Xylanimonas ulmi TaxID=228973 RepID=A0A4Q7M6F6_9MICO|nr:ribonuclease P protein component [Xylanibacterium ulmi]
MVVHLLVDNEGDAAPLVGFVVSKAVGNSVQRNRVKRRLRAIVRSVIADGAGLPAHARVVVRALPAAGSATFTELSRDVVTACERASERAGRRAAAVSTP